MEHKDTRKKGIVILSFLGLGDLLVCSPIFRQKANEYSTVIVPASGRYKKTAMHLFRDRANIFVQSFPDEINHSGQIVQQIFLKKFGFHTLRLGRFESEYLQEPGIRADEYFYKQANLNFDTRWTEFQFVRDYSRERHLEAIFGIDDKPFIFLHQDKLRGMEVDIRTLSPGLRIVEPNPSLKEFTLLDYIGIIERATEIHCIESSFSALIESLSVDIPKYIHRYSRVKVSENPQNEFTYRTDWQIIVKPK